MTRPPGSKGSALPDCALGLLVIAGCLLAAPVDAREGDLDPAFGDVGRVGPIASVPGTGWSIYPMEDRSLVIGGGAISRSCPSDIIGCEPPRYVGYSARSFVIHVSDTGQLLESHDIAASNFHLLAIDRQTNGKFLVAGRRLNERSLDSEFVVYRLNPDGSLDMGFGTDGLVQLPVAERGDVDEATAVLVEPDSRIVVAGSRLRSGHRSQILVRLLVNGEFDQAFGSSGIVVLSGRDTSSVYAVELPLFYRMQVLRTDAGAYRVSVPGWCQVMGLTPDGTFDPEFGSSGTVKIHHPISNGCSLMIAMLSGGRLGVGASDGEAAVVTRLLADGQPDPTFLRGTSLQDRLGYIISALAVGPDDSTFIALGLSDFGYHGLEVKKLLPNGLLAESFGNSGSVKIDNMPSEFGGSAYLLFDMLVREEGLIVGTGGKPFSSQSDGPIVVQLLGPGAGDGPGVLSLPGFRRSVHEELTEVSVEARRTGGDAGRVSIAYRVVELESDSASAATGDEDFVLETGRLEWQDGDATNRQIRVRIINDDQPEDDEDFAVLLTDAEGGVGLGTAGQIIRIEENDGFVPPPPPSPVVFRLATTAAVISETAGSIALAVIRTGSSVGAVSVDYATSSGTAAAGADFASASGTLHWADGDSGNKTIAVNITNDTTDESDEWFTVRLSNPSAGTALRSSGATVTITDDDAPAPPPTIALAASSAQVREGGSVDISVVRGGSSAGALSVNYQTASGTATAGTDFTGASGTLTWADGDSVNKTVRVSTLGDATNESDETFTVTLSNPSAGATLGSMTTTTVTISDDDSSGGGSAGSGGGGGTTGVELLALLGLLAILKRPRGQLRRAAARRRQHRRSGHRRDR